MSEAVKIGYVGMTHLGLVMSLSTAMQGYPITCYDENALLVKQLQAGHFPIDEPDFVSSYQQAKDQITYVGNLDALMQCQLVFLSIDVPTDEQGESDLGTIEFFINHLFSTINKQATLIVLSQVKPGFLQQFKCYGDRLIYQVETLVFGSAMTRALTPERYIVGCVNKESPLPLNYRVLLEKFNCPIIKTDYASAELTKLAINMYLSSTVTMTNALSQLCVDVGGDWRDIRHALRLDKRIGQYAYLEPGLGITGGNIERDLFNIKSLSQMQSKSFIASIISHSHYRRQWLAEKLATYLDELADPKARIGMLGLSYKPNTHSIKNSSAVALLEAFSAYHFQVHDPKVNLDHLEMPEVEICQSINEVMNHIDVLVIATPWDDYKQLTPAVLNSLAHNVMIIDPFSIVVDQLNEKSNYNYETFYDKRHHKELSCVN